MKNLKLYSLILFGAMFLTIGFTSCDKSDENDDQNNNITLTEKEKADLLFMREEEKLARDVYVYLYEKYDMNVFNNISASEQKHMDAVLTIMEKYGITDISSTEYGVFTNTSLQQLYDDLIAQGDISLIEALKVGATIEDVDIKDLNNAIESTNNIDLVDMYEMLACGSRNHLRGFTGQLDDRDEVYIPQFISQEIYDDILNGSHENCGN